ncbi:TPA: hypothetical protein NGT07_004460 [Vibrio parahaemolyticus]|nr:hypothetical protein [Vibrio parahaemolyticus]
MKNKKPGNTLVFIMLIDLAFIAAILVFCYYQWSIDPIFFYEHKVAPLTIFLSACLGVLSAVFAAMSSRRETVRQNTLDLLNKLDSDGEYWMEADKLTCTINHFRQKRVDNKFCSHKSLVKCNCSLSSLAEIDKEFEEYVNLNPYSKLTNKVNNHQTNAYVRTNLVIRKMEWLCERAENGLIDYTMLAKRKGVMINFIYDACESIICQKISTHSEKYGSYGDETKSLVYSHISQKKIRAKLYRKALKEAVKLSSR